MVLFYSWEPGAVGSGSGHALPLGSGLITKATLERWRVTQRTLPSMPGAGPRPRWAAWDLTKAFCTFVLPDEQCVCRGGIYCQLFPSFDATSLL